MAHGGLSLERLPLEGKGILKLYPHSPRRSPVSTPFTEAYGLHAASPASVAHIYRFAFMLTTPQ
jgi:hypothetical protein